MKNESRIVELLTEMVQKQDQMADQLVKLNLQTAENTRSIFKLEQIVDHEKRISKLEGIVLK
jgi:hypothetical protein